MWEFWWDEDQICVLDSVTSFPADFWKKKLSLNASVKNYGKFLSFGTLYITQNGCDSTKTLIISRSEHTWDRNQSYQMSSYRLNLGSTWI